MGSTGRQQVILGRDFSGMSGVTVGSTEVQREVLETPTAWELGKILKILAGHCEIPGGDSGRW